MLNIERTLWDVSTDRIRSHISALEGVRHPLAAPEALERAAAYLRSTFRPLGYELSEHRFTDSGQEFANVIATRRGCHRPEERVLVIAHYDTVATTPGADDNASGVAVMLELATVLAPLQSDRTIQFVGVNLEENEREGDGADLGTRGSRALARHARDNCWAIEGVVVLESVAYAGELFVQKAPTGIPVAVPDRGNFIAVVGNDASKGLVHGFERAAAHGGLQLPCVSLTVPGNGEVLPDSRRSDHAPFWDRGYAAIMVTDTTNFRNPHYHLPSDTLDTLNLDFAADVCRATALLLTEMAGSTLIP